jgi:hypothetical protein
MRGLSSRAGGVLPPYRDHSRLKREGVDVWLDKEKPVVSEVEPSCPARIGNWKSARRRACIDV